MTPLRMRPLPMRALRMRPLRRPAGPPRLARRDRGSMAVELVIAAPALMVLLLVLSAGGEWLNLNGAVGAAARDSARAASLARDYAAAQLDAQQAASADLGDICYGTIPVPQIHLYKDGAPDTDADPFATAQEIQVTVSCVASLGVFRDVGYKTGHTFTAAAFAPLDPFVDRG
jgi:Flp pilus assembly protein TadG